ncbi:MAG: P1 family peptidase [Sphingomonadaceae bacterium]
MAEPGGSTGLLPAGLKVGHAHDARAATGVTVMLPASPVVMAVDVRGGGPGTRETDALNPWNLVERVHALVLSGGSVFGLAAADEAALWLARRGIGLEMGEGLPRVPVVPAAILFDLANGGDKSWALPVAAEDPPYRQLARAALLGATPQPAVGRVGAGYGARSGSQPGGIGIASVTLDGGGRMTALVAVNSFGEVTGDMPPLTGPVPMPKGRAISGANTCIGAVATDIPLTRAAAFRVAMMAHDGLARTIRPVHTPFDGDTLFALSVATATPTMVDPMLLTELGTRAADCVARAVLQVVGRDGY